MTIRANQYPVPNLIVPQNVLVSVFDKTDLEVVVAGIRDVNPGAIFYSTGGTGRRLVEILGPDAGTQFVSIESFTGAPEMEGGLVKTLHPKVHAGLLAERGNEDHQAYLERTMVELTGTPGVYFDVMIGGLYPFEKVTGRGATAEEARDNIDIGGPTMVMAAAKNWHSVAVVTSPKQYETFCTALAQQRGTTAKQRFDLGREAMDVIGGYRRSIADHFRTLNFERDVAPELTFTEE